MRICAAHLAAALTRAAAITPKAIVMGAGVVPWVALSGKSGLTDTTARMRTAEIATGDILVVITAIAIRH
jgi:hypothetical protein